MKKLLVMIIIVLCFKLANSAPIEGHQGRAARQWMMYDEPPFYAIYPDHQEPIPYLYPYYNPAEINLQLAEPIPYNQIIYYNQPLHYAPHVQPSKLKPSVQIIDKGSKISTILKSKLKIAQKLFGMFGIKLGEKKPLLSHKEETNTVADYNTVSILPDRLGNFLAKLKEESIQRSEGMYDVPESGETEKGKLNTMISNVDLEQPESSSDNSIVSSQQVRSNDETLNENNSEENEKAIDEIKVLSDEDIGELIRFFDTVRDIYEKSGPHSPTDTIEIKIKGGQPKSLSERNNMDKTECDFNSSEERDDDRIFIKSSNCDLIMSVSLSQQTENNRKIEETLETTDLAEGLKELQLEKNLDVGKTNAQEVIQVTATTVDLTSTDTSRIDIKQYEDITEKSTEDIIRSLDDTDVNTKLESPNDGSISPRTLLTSSTIYSITESTSPKLNEPSTEPEMQYTINETHTSQTAGESKNIDQQATGDLLQTATSLYH